MIKELRLKEPNYHLTTAYGHFGKNNLSYEKLDKVKKGIKITRFLRHFGIDLRRTVFKDIHEKFGGKLRLLIAGGAAFDKEAEKGIGRENVFA